MNYLNFNILSFHILYKILLYLFIVIIYFISLLLLLFYNSNNSELQFHNNFFNGINSFHLFFLLLTTFLFPIILLIRDYNKSSELEWNILFIILLLLIIIFTTSNLFLFYISFELSLIPLFIIIILYGSRYKKIEAAYKLFIYTFLGSLYLLLILIYVYLIIGSFNNYILSLYIPNTFFIWFAFILSFAIKIPIYPFHSWLPYAHVEAPTFGSVLLAGLILKVGSYGFIIYNFNYFKSINYYYSPILITFAILSILIASFIIINILDMKQIIAYSSIIHMNYIILGLFTINNNGIIGTILYNISHGLISSALFILIGILYKRYKIRNILYYKGLTHIMPLFSIFLFIFIMSNLSLPLTSSFISEFYLLLSFLFNSIWFGILVIIMLLFNTIYNFNILNKLLYGNITIYINKFKDITYNEYLILIPLFIINLYIGILPNNLINILYNNVNSLIILINGY